MKHTFTDCCCTVGHMDPEIESIRKASQEIYRRTRRTAAPKLYVGGVPVTSTEDLEEKLGISITGVDHEDD